ncbi:MAG TPA: transcriptional regulator [Paraburkholderia sp.]|jgi:hypothetical protein
MAKTRALILDAMIVTGNTKAAVKAAGGGSSDLWTVPADQIHYDPRDNVRPLDPVRVRHLADLIKVNGYDRKKPLGCFVRKVGGEDRIFVYEGQHRFHAALLAIKEGTALDRLPIVIDEAKSVNRANLIYAGITNNDGEKLTPLQLAEKVIELQELGESTATICQRLNITDQTIRDVLLLANAPAALHKLVRDKVVSSTLAIEEIRTHGGEKALDRLANAATQAKVAGKAKVTKKALDKPADAKISPVHAKQLLQALRLVRDDAAFRKLKPATVIAVTELLSCFPDLTFPNFILPPPTSAAKPQARAFPVSNANGAFSKDDCLELQLPNLRKNWKGLPLASIFVVEIDEDMWLVSCQITTSQGGTGGLPLQRHVDEFDARPAQEHTNIRMAKNAAIAAGATEIANYASSQMKQTDEAKQIAAWANRMLAAANEGKF